MENKESFTGLEKYSTKELELGMDEADSKGWWKGFPLGTISKVLSDRRQSTEQTPPVEAIETEIVSSPVSQKPKGEEKKKRRMDTGAQQRFLVDQQSEYLGGPDYSRRLSNINRNRR